MLSRYDGERTVTWVLDDAQEIEAALDTLQAVPASPGQALRGLPVFLLCAYRSTGPSITQTLYCWTHQAFLRPDGTVLRAAVDTDALLAQGNWSLLWDNPGLHFPVPQQKLALSGGTWNPAYLQEVACSDTLTVSHIEAADGVLSCELKNRTRAHWAVNVWELLVELDGRWYEVPCLPQHLAGFPVLTVLPAGHTETAAFPITEDYGDLPDGDYCVVLRDDDQTGLFARALPFTVSDGALIPTT